MSEPINLKVGQKVMARWNGGTRQYPGKIVEVQEDKVFIHYDDGDEEWTTPEMVEVVGSTTDTPKNQAETINDEVRFQPKSNIRQQVLDSLVQGKLKAYGRLVEDALAKLGQRKEELAH